MDAESAVSLAEDRRFAFCEGSGVYIYSCVTNGYDLVFPPVVPNQDVKFALFTDSSRASGAWHRLPLKEELPCDISSNRYHKFFAHKLFPNADYSIYIDGNIGIIGDLAPLLDEFIASKAALGVFRHRDRLTVREEVAACIDTDKFDDADMLAYSGQVEHMLESGMPENQRLSDNAIIFRWHRHAKLAQTMEDWWEQFNAYTKRDQISLPFVLWKNDTPMQLWEWSFRVPNTFFEKYPHKGTPLRNMKYRLKNAYRRHTS